MENGSAPVTVLIVDDQVLFRRAAAAVVRITRGFELVGEAESGEEAVELSHQLEPSMILMDINMSGINGIEASRRITTAHPDTVVVLLSTYRREDLPSDAHVSGMAAYVNKDEFGPQVLTDVWNAAHGAGAAPGT
ncbi:MAG TPA: response regulator transcription factor [Acidimicrobiales bacterium]|nr:response regulator transcription factor [Acidimicrobiales bacterium]